MELATPEELREAAAHWDHHAECYRTSHRKHDPTGQLQARAMRLAASLRAAATILENVRRRVKSDADSVATI